jgi:hypothetical protein
LRRSRPPTLHGHHGLSPARVSRGYIYGLRSPSIWGQHGSPSLSASKSWDMVRLQSQAIPGPKPRQTAWALDDSFLHQFPSPTSETTVFANTSASTLNCSIPTGYHHPSLKGSSLPHISLDTRRHQGIGKDHSITHSRSTRVRLTRSPTPGTWRMRP